MAGSDGAKDELKAKKFKFLVEIVADETENAANIADRLEDEARRISPMKFAQILASSEPPPNNYDYSMGMYVWINWRQR